MTMPFADRLNSAILAKRTCAMVGIDPQWEMLPDPIRRAAVAEHGPTLDAVAAAYLRFGTHVIDLVADLVPAVKFQSAFFEAVGPSGMQTLGVLMQQARAAGLIVILDGKRNDIGNTAAAYAQAYLGGMTIEGQTVSTAWRADAITVNPYLGAEGLKPFIQAAGSFGGGLFVLVRTSNPGAGKLQDLAIGETTIYQTIADWVEEWSAASAAQNRYGCVGAVVGATVPAQVTELRRRMRHVILLIPGYGAQGGKAADIAGAFDADGLGAIVNNSRGILYAYHDPARAGAAWQDALVAATRDMIADLRRSAIPGWKA